MVWELYRLYFARDIRFAVHKRQGTSGNNHKIESTHWTNGTRFAMSRSIHILNGSLEETGAKWRLVVV